MEERWRVLCVGLRALLYEGLVGCLVIHSYVYDCAQKAVAKIRFFNEILEKKEARNIIEQHNIQCKIQCK
jgi:hypothetical protein